MAIEYTYKPGDVVLFTYPAVYRMLPEYRAHSGQFVTIVRPCIDGKEYDYEGDAMYRCIAADGWEGDIWESELGDEGVGW